MGTPSYYKSPFFHYHADTLGVQEVQANIEVCFLLSVPPLSLAICNLCNLKA